MASAVWIAGGLATGSARELIWVAALVVDYAAPAARFAVPGLGRSRTADWTVTASYIAERFKLFVILALGESIIVTGIAFSELEPDGATLAAFASAFVATVAMWWVYFHRSAEAGEHAMARSGDPGRLARSAYTYSHLPIVAGIIIVAVADELVIAHPTGHAEPATIATALGGPALFLAGHAIFKYTVFGVVSIPRLVAIAVLGALVPIGQLLSPLALGAAATLVVVGVAVQETLAHRRSIGEEQLAIDEA
jgi:low temperature requirement protein LtrA